MKQKILTKRNENGQGLVEYSLIGALVAVILIGVLIAIGPAIKTAMVSLEYHSDPNKFINPVSHINHCRHINYSSYIYRSPYIYPYSNINHHSYIHSNHTGMYRRKCIRFKSKRMCQPKCKQWMLILHIQEMEPIMHMEIG